MRYGFYEFFAGGGMARLGLGQRWHCLFANDNSPKKIRSYRTNFGHEDSLSGDDVHDLRPEMIPGYADLAWASFPCQDLSLAGNGGGLNSRRSGTFWPFWHLMERLAVGGRAPAVVVLENVVGALSSHKGRDFEAIISAVASEGYWYGALVLDAVHFVPQSRPRLFVVASRGEPPSQLIATADLEPGETASSKLVIRAFDRLPEELKQRWVWWDLPEPPQRRSAVDDILEDRPSGVEWHSPEYTNRLLEMMSPINIQKVHAAQAEGGTRIGFVYRRTRREDGQRVQRAEVRFDGIAGCLRTPAGGSSRQTVLLVEDDCIRSRLLSPREAARLMGVPESYVLPESYNEAYHLMGDGLVVPVVSWLESQLITPLLASVRTAAATAGAHG